MEGSATRLYGLAAGLVLLAACGAAVPDPGRGPALVPEPVPQRRLQGPDERLAGAPAAPALYVAIDGDDAADGLTPDRALASLAAALDAVRVRGVDRIRLRRGDVHVLAETVRITHGGASAARPLVIEAFGDGPRPVLRSRAEVAVSVGGPAPVAHLVLRGLALEPARSDAEIGDGISEGLRIAADDGARETARDVHLEDLVIRGFGVGLNALGANTLDTHTSDTAGGDRRGGIVGLSLRRTLVLDTHHAANAIGMLFVGVSGLSLDEVVVDRVQRDAGRAPSVFDHAVYVQTDCRDVVIRSSIFARAPDGVMQRAGGVLEDSVVVDVAIGALEGYVFAGAVPTPGGVTFRVERNVFLALGDLSPALPRGIGMYVGNTREGTIAHNVFARSVAASPWSGWALALLGETNEGNVGVGTLDVVDNRFVALPTTLRLAGARFGRVRFARNVVGELLAPTPFASLDGEVALALEGNASTGPVEGWTVATAGREEPLPTWLARRGASFERVTLADAGRDLGGYHASLGGAPTTEAFLEAVRAQAEHGFRDALSGRAASAWIRAGHTLAPQHDELPRR
jgi:hypothetical protein